jgi:hypothetical protein
MSTSEFLLFIAQNLCPSCLVPLVLWLVVCIPLAWRLGKRQHVTLEDMLGEREQ